MLVIEAPSPSTHNAFRFVSVSSEGCETSSKCNKRGSRFMEGMLRALLGTTLLLPCGWN